METNNDSISNSMAGSKLVSSIALTKPLTSEQQKKRAAMLFGNALYKKINSIMYLKITKYLCQTKLIFDNEKISCRFSWGNCGKRAND